MNDKGKTVKEIRGIKPCYRRIGRGKKEYRCIEISMQLVLTGEGTEPPGFAGTMDLIERVSSRAIDAVAKEFLP